MSLFDRKRLESSPEWAYIKALIEHTVADLKDQAALRDPPDKVLTTRGRIEAYLNVLDMPKILESNGDRRLSLDPRYPSYMEKPSATSL